MVVAAVTDEYELDRAIEVARTAGAAIEASGEAVIPAERASARVEAELSSAFAPAPRELSSRLGTAVEGVLEDVAFGRNQRALDVAQPLLAQLDPHLPAIGRDEQLARDVANLCLFAVRAHVQKRDAGAASQQVQLCLRLVPDLQADPSVHPPSVRELVDAARAALDGGSGGILAVQSRPSDPSGCAIRVNGRAMGRTPVLRIALPPATYAVQVECREGRAGRVYAVPVTGAEPARVVIAAGIAQALETGSGLALVYRDLAELDAELARDVEALAAAVGAQRVLVVSRREREATLRAFSVGVAGTAELTNAVPVAEPVDDASSRRAVRAVIEGRSVEASVAVVPEPRSEGPDAGRLVLGTSLVLAGAAGLGVSWYLWVDLEARGRAIADATTPAELGQTQLAYDDAQLPLVATALASSVIATVGVPVLLPEEREFPWWSAVFGAAGVGLAAAGIYYTTVEGGCYGNVSLGAPCARRSQTAIFGGLLLEHAAPLLAVPITHLFQLALVGGDVRASAALRIDAEQSTLMVRGEW